MDPQACTRPGPASTPAALLPHPLQGFTQLGLQATYNDGAGDVERDFLLCWHAFQLEGLWMTLMPGAGAPAGGGASSGHSSQAMLTEMVEMLEGCFPGAQLRLPR
jgi:hypothetical protein